MKKTSITMNHLIDQSCRDEALNVEQSCIVQAPAGSGKTELLVQRYLKLLSYVKNPEEILAFTFTRKAAQEMRERIIQALKNSDSLTNVCSKDLAEKALEQNKLMKWNLLENTDRLRIQTIDAFCHSLLRMLPATSSVNSQAEIEEHAENLYHRAARAFLMQLETAEAVSANYLQKILLHLNNDFVTAEKLFVLMLSQRDQWLPHIMTAKKNKLALRAYLNSVLETLVNEVAKKCYDIFPQQFKTELIQLFNFANHFQLSELSQEYGFWKQIGHFLLNNDLEWRKIVDKRNGFPPNEKLYKKRMMNLLQQLSCCEELKTSLQSILLCPEKSYSDNEWHIIEPLIELLPLLVAELLFVFSETKKVDFIQIITSAIYALGEMDTPSDLALKLDFQIQHILIDEFQDTSATQFRLLEHLTNGWQYFDGRTLFLVGDPMQSIYRFRKADVGLFLVARNKGINSIHLRSLILQVNFRSTKGITDWLNTTFMNIFPKQENISEGAVSFSPCQSFSNEENNSSVIFHPLVNATKHDQAMNIAQWIKNYKITNPQSNIGILIRQRSDLKELIPALKEHEILFHGQELDALIDNAIIQDLIALTRALLHPADRIAWLAILRAPWCGLTLADLHVIANYDKDDTIIAILKKILLENILSADGTMRVRYCFSILERYLFDRGRISLSNLIKNAWFELSGPACVAQVHDLQYAEVFFDLLLESETDNYSELIPWLENALTQRYLNVGNERSNVEIMTIHKAKGLEFDVVLLPFLEKISRYDGNKLMLWEEFTQVNGNIDFILAPVPSSYKENSNSVFNYLKTLENKKAYYELQRLFYVATTRARKSLQLFANVDRNADGEFKPPRAHSFLELIWPMVKDKFEALLANTYQTQEKKAPCNVLMRFKSEFFTSL